MLLKLTWMFIQFVCDLRLNYSVALIIIVIFIAIVVVETGPNHTGFVLVIRVIKGFELVEYSILFVILTNF